ncbi:AAA family ATPase [Anaeromicropila herbilytica]|uniref:AAA+ ATPase domain-containing protein n=1 Tax=Anaeromicropila herbilytica TaxID=2785025 RepID=A0A7R7ICF7_9FIRM|nr:AAA family ATPase [Anaeromicropila herbilytica]BCN29869.1 hypothetical protein bsdtb5_11640 [Anaeromicropila herbilytica]
MNFTDVIRFLFPEYQAVDAIMEYGFIKNKKSVYNQNHAALQRLAQTVNNGTTNLNTDRGRSNTISNNINNINNTNNTTNDNTAKYQHKDNLKVNNDEISIKFTSIRKDLANNFVGQIKYLDNLCLAFKRPFITGYDNVKPKNVIIVLGNKSSGKHTSIKYMARFLKERKLISSKKVVQIDLSLYPTTSEFQLFISDIYKNLYDDSNILIFNNFHKGHSSAIEVIQTLVTTGEYTLGTRYIVENGALVETTGALMENTISNISTNGKYFIIVSEKSEKEIQSTFGLNFMKCVGDIIHTDPYTEEELGEMVDCIIDEIISRCNKNLSMDLSYDDKVTCIVVSGYKNITGIAGMSDFIESSIYKPLAQLKLKNNYSNKKSVIISVRDERLIAKIGEDSIFLDTVLPKIDSYGLEEIKNELNQIVGIESVKNYILSLQENLQIQKLRESKGLKAANISMNMIFTGNPGTGKTTIARIVAKYLKALGILSQGQLREVTRADMVGQYVGHTAKITNEVVRSAIGGVLFIDEAYALCRDKEDSFGLEAIDALVKGIEDNKDDLVVILAGYKEEMDGFLKTNSGLKSRFPNIINFEDFTVEEMYQISLITAKSKEYIIAEDCKESLIKLFEKKQIKGKNDSGNGRLVRNVIESAILKQSKRILNNNTEALDLLKYEDFEFEEVSKFDIEASLSKIIGLDTVKEFVRTQYRLLIAMEKRRKAGMVVDTTQSLNMIFSGNPGTGKTTIARLVASMFKEMGLLKSGHLVETDRSGLVAEYVGQTSKKTEEIFKSALGGILFIDEAYALADDTGYGKEAIDTLVKLIEDFRGEIVVILAGYKKEMSNFLNTNSGLQSRFPLHIEFPDYQPEDLYEITLKMIKEKGFILANNVDELIKEQIYQLHKQSDANSGNGRMVRNYLEEVMRKQSSRIAINDIPNDEMNIILTEDIVIEVKSKSSYDLDRELSKIVGQEEVKEYIKSLNARLRMQNERKKLGLVVDATQTLHMIFKGNPGTGKTMIARTIADVLYNIGVIKTNKLVETDRSGLVAGYVGQTAIKTREKIMEALDGVLFIDEAYSLSQGGENDFGKEAIDTLVKLMDDYRDRIIVILAGYSGDMDHFLSMNAGLKSRFPNIIEFKDYSTEQLMEISDLLFNNKGYELDEKAKVKLMDIFNQIKSEPQFGNGRYVRNVYERAVNNQALRLSSDMDLTKQELMTILDTDIMRI